MDLNNFLYEYSHELFLPSLVTKDFSGFSTGWKWSWYVFRESPENRGVIRPMHNRKLQNDIIRPLAE